MNALKKMFSMFNTRQRLGLLGMSVIILGGAGMELIALYAFNNFIEAIMMPDNYFLWLSIIHPTENLFFLSYFQTQMTTQQKL